MSTIQIAEKLRTLYRTDYPGFEDAVFNLYFQKDLDVPALESELQSTPQILSYLQETFTELDTAEDYGTNLC